MNNGRCPAGRIVQNENSGSQTGETAVFLCEKEKTKEEHLMY